MVSAPSEWLRRQVHLAARYIGPVFSVYRACQTASLQPSLYSLGAEERRSEQCVFLRDTKVSHRPAHVCLFVTDYDDYDSMDQLNAKVKHLSYLESDKAGHNLPGELTHVSQSRTK